MALHSGFPHFCGAFTLRTLSYYIASLSSFVIARPKMTREWMWYWLQASGPFLARRSAQYPTSLVLVDAPYVKEKKERKILFHLWMKALSVAGFNP